ncbi:P-type conjugative transfer protein TrbL [Acidithiobacillus sulfuriphilus]|uniref:P-type conjugative transfer protein TrbL n=1 Tax=Acidithiobacillus sulfuriphilus TaxID=1867749 RepID=UPI003F5E47F0
MKSMNKRPHQFFVGLALTLMPAAAMASQYLNQVQSDLQGKILPWQGIMQTAATDLFYALAAVEFSVLFLNHVLQKRGHEDLFAGIIKKVVTLGFFLTVLNNSGTWIPDIINGLAGGAHALGVTSVSPSGIAQEALQVFLGVALAPLAAAKHNLGTVMGDLGNLDFTGALSATGDLLANSNPVSLVIELLISAIIGLLAGIGVLVMALEFLMVQLESYLVIALGVIMLSGGGLRWTAKYVGSYIDYAINVGVRLFILTALAFLVTYSISPIMMTIMETVTNPLQMGFEMLILGAVIALLPRKASSIANSLLSGNSTFEGGEMAKTAGIIGGGTVLAVGGLGALGAGVAGGLSSGGLSAAAGAGGAGGGGLAGGSLAGAAGMGEGAAAAGVAAPEVGAMSAGGGYPGAAHAVPAPEPLSSGSATGQAAQRGVQTPSVPQSGSSAAAGTGSGAGAPAPASGPKGEGGAGSSASEANPDAPPAPVNAVPAPEPVGTPTSGGGQGSTAAPAPSAPTGAPASGGASGSSSEQPKSAVEKLKDGYMDRAKSHVEDAATGKSVPVQKNAIDTSHSRDFD